MLRDKAGNRLFRRIDIKIIFPIDTIPNQKFSQRAGAHQGFGPDGLDDILMQVADKLDTLYPWWDFKMVELAPEGRTAKYVFRFLQYRISGTKASGPVPEVAPVSEVAPDGNAAQAV